MIIDTDNYEASGIEVIQFAGGEFHAKIGDRSGMNSVHIFAKIRSWNDFGKLLVVVDAFRRQRVVVYLFMPYLPAARQDRCQDGTALTSAIYAHALQTVSHLTYVDVHSLAAQIVYGDEYYHKAMTEMPFNFVKELITTRPVAVLAPDKGAVGRAAKIAELIGSEIPVFNCTKEREFETGKLLRFEVPDDIPVGKVLIADDICDGGGTFLGIASELLKRNQGHTLDLYVSHGIFSQGLDKLLAVFNTIYTTNSWNQHTNDRLKVLDLLPYYIGGLRP